jgi:predicted permease
MIPQLRALLVRLVRLVYRPAESELEDELGFHAEQLAEDNMRAGMSAAEARRQARIALGGLEQIKEECYDALFVRLLRDLLQDVRYGMRQLRRMPSFTAAAVLTLALGIGANTAIFQLLDLIVLRPLPVREPNQLIRLQGYQNGQRQGFTYPLLREMSARQRTLQGIFASGQFRIREASFGGRGLNNLDGAWAVTANYFRLIGTDPQFGRFFADADDEAAATPVAVISDRLWRAEFAAQRAAVGSTINLNGTTVTIVGVARPEFFGDRVGTFADLWVPLHLIAPLWSPGFLQSSTVWLYPMARLKSDVPLPQAQAEISVLWMQLKKFGMQIEDSSGYHVELVPAPQGIGDLNTQFSRSLWLLMATVGLVALIACCNLANLLLARTTARTREISVRLALGAGRTRLIRQLVTENLVLSTLGGGIGFALAALASRQLVVLASAGETWQISTSIDWRIAGFTMLVTLASAILFGLAPAFTATRVGLNVALQNGRRTQIGSHSGHATAKAFVVAQVALSLVLVSGASLLVRSFWKLTHQGLGFRPKGVLVATVQGDRSAFKDLQDAAKHLAIVQRLSEVPGVRIAASAVAGPLGTVTSDVAIALPGRALPPRSVNEVLVGPGYFDAMGVSIIAGRPITREDRKDAPGIAVLNESAARLMFGKRNAVGSFFTEGKEFDQQKAIQVVGVVQDLRYSSPRDPFVPLVFYPVTQKFVFSSPTFVLRTEGDPLQFTDAVRQAVREVAPALRVTRACTLDSMVETAARRERLLAWLSGCFGSLALILAAVGLYGVVAYAVERRTPEMGVRLALGAQPYQIPALLLREVAILLAIGLLLGATATVLFTSLLKPILFDISPQDPAMLGFAVALLSGVALAAGYLPARRAARLDPMSALRAE